MITDAKCPSSTAADGKLIVTPADLSDSLDTTLLNIAGLSVPMGNGFSSLRLALGTGVRKLGVWLLNNNVGQTLYSLGCAVFVDGVFSQIVEPTTINSIDVATILFDGAPHTVEIVNGIGGGWPILAARIYAVTFSGGPVSVLPNPISAHRVSVFGDSISIGARADYPPIHGWIPLVRAAVPSLRISLEGYGSRALMWETIPDLAARLVALCFGAARRTVIDAIDYNDWYSGVWTAAQFGAACGSLYDAIHALDPSITIYAQTALITSNEAATNANDETIADFRAAKVAAAATRAFVTLVDGTAPTTVSHLDEGVHPNTAGHADIAAYYAALLAA